MNDEANESDTGITLADRLAQFAVDCRRGVPDDVSESVRRRVLDILGISVAASTLSTSRGVRRLATRQGGRAESSAIGVETKLPAASAAFVNGVLAHSLDYDDTHLPSVLHPSASVVPAAVAIAEAYGASGQSLVNAIAAGLEVAVRVGMAGYDRDRGTSLFFEHGQHATSICGTLGSATAASLLLGASATGVRDGLSIAASMSSGILEANRTGGTVKRMHCGWAAQSGISAALLVSEGWTGPATVFEGRFGFFEAWLHQPGNAAEITEDLGRNWEVPSIFFKPYPANHFTHSAVDAAAALRRRGLQPDQVKSARLAVPHPNVRTIGEPLAMKQAPSTGYMAQFSGPYAVAAGLCGGGGLEVGLADYSDDLALDDSRRKLMSKVEVVGSAECDAVYPHQFPAILTVTTVDGGIMEERVMTTRGGPERPLSFDEIAAKYNDNVRDLLDNEAAAKLQRDVSRLDKQDMVDDLLTAARKIDPLERGPLH